MKQNIRILNTTSTQCKRKKYRMFVFCLLHAVWVTLLCYMVSNTSYSLGDEEAFMQHLYFAKQKLWPATHEVPSNALLVNVGYDKQLINVTDEYGMPMGQLAVTDRNKLFYFLEKVHKVNNYRYIMLDVFFGNGLNTPNDSTLFALITKMRNIVIPRHKDAQLADTALLNKAAIADYSTSINEGNFVKYQFIHQQKASIPWKMYADYTAARWQQWGPFYRCNGKLCYKCIFLNYRVKPESAYNADGQKNFYNLGSDLTDMMEEIDWEQLLCGKVIVIGNLVEEDIHDTYVGKMSGALINLNAFYALMQGDHYVVWSSMGILFIVYLLMSWLLLKQINWNDIPLLRKIHSTTWRYVYSWIGISTLLCIVCIGFYLLTGHVYDILIISTYFTFYKLIVQLYYTHKKRKTT